MTVDSQSFAPEVNLSGLGLFVYAGRRRLGITQTQLGKRIGFSQERVSVLEHGKYGMPSLLALAQLASALDASLADIVKAVGFDAGVTSAVALTDMDPNASVALLQVVHQMLAIEATSLRDALTQAASLLARVMAVDKIDAFVHDPETDTLVAVGASRTAMGRLQHQIGMDRMPIVNRGREVEVFKTGESYMSGDTKADVHMHLGTTEGLGVQSMLAVPLDVAGVRRGVLVAMDARRDIFRGIDLLFFETLARWVGMVLQHAEARAESTSTAAAKAQGVAEGLMTILAHDLQNHLTPLAGQLDLLRRRLEKEGRGNDLTNIVAARQATQRVSHLASQLLDTVRLDEGIFALHYASTDLPELVRQSVLELGTVEEQIQMDMPATLVAEIDPDRVRQVLDNVLRNAIRYSPPGASVYVDMISHTSNGAEWAILSIRDQGAGIHPDLLPGIFVRFARGPGSSGLGLGLYVARGVVDAHGGTLTVDSTVGGGTTFRFSLPVHRAA